MHSYKLLENHIGLMKLCLERHSINNPGFISFMSMPFGFNDIPIFQNSIFELHTAHGVSEKFLPS